MTVLNVIKILWTVFLRNLKFSLKGRGEKIAFLVEIFFRLVKIETRKGF